MLHKRFVGTHRRAYFIIGSYRILQNFQRANDWKWHISIGYKHYAACKNECS